MKKFDFVIGNPPYQEETAIKESDNNQKTTKSIFHHFQEEADKIAGSGTCMIYPGGRWIHQAGKGMAEFGSKQINDPKLSKLVFYKLSSDVFSGVAINDGVSIVVKNSNKTSLDFKYEYIGDGEDLTALLHAPGDKLMPLYPKDGSIVSKIDAFVAQNKLSYLNDNILPRSLFGIESDYVSKNKGKVRPLRDDELIDYSKEVKLLTNDKAGSAGRTMWFVIDRNDIPKGQDFIDKWKVVVISANAGGQRRDNRMEIIDNHSAFGRSKVALRVFESKKEAENFFKYMSSLFIKYTLLLTNENLTSVAKRTPDIENYTDSNKFIDFSKEIDPQLCKLLSITDEEFAYIKNKIETFQRW